MSKRVLTLVLSSVIMLANIAVAARYGLTAGLVMYGAIVAFGLTMDLLAARLRKQNAARDALHEQLRAAIRGTKTGTTGKEH